MKVKSSRSIVVQFLLLLCASLFLLVACAARAAKTEGAEVVQADNAGAIAFNITQSETGGGNVFYVAPDGSSDAKGKKKKKAWDLETALSHPGKIKPGDTIYLRGGVYKGKFISKLTGSPAAPITVRSYPGEWAKIDGYLTATLVSGIGPSSTSLTLSDASSIPEGADVLIDGEMIKVFGKKGNTFTDLVRGASGGGQAASHASGAKAVLGGSVLGIFGADTIYRDLEIMNSWPERDETQSGISLDLARGEGISVRGPRIKIINTIIHDNVNGIGSWSQAPDNEVYGNVIYNNGWLVGPQNPHGHGMYLENASGYKRILDNIILNSFNLGTQAFGVTGPFVGGRFEGNVYSNNGSPTGRDSEWRTINLLIGTQSQAIPSVDVIDNYFYYPSNVSGTNLKLGYGVPDNGRLTMTGNSVMGGGQQVQMKDWINATVTGNTFYSSNERIILLNRPAGGDYDWNRNRYYSQARPENCIGGNRRASFGLNSEQGGCGGPIDFNEWKAASGFDSKSTYSESKPVSSVIIRVNQYEPGRANIIVYNWDLKSTINVDVSSVIRPGTSFEIRNAQDYSGEPVFTGTYDGKSIALPMTQSSVARPIGYDFTPQFTGPEFNVFVLISR